MTEKQITKFCPGCQIKKPVSEFSKAKSRKDGLQVWCDCCRKEYYQRNKDSIAERSKEYRGDNKETISRQKKEYYEVNKDDIAAYKKEYRLANKAEISAHNKEYYENNKDAISVRMKEWCGNNKDVISAQKKEYHQTKNGKAVHKKADHKRRALKLNATIEDFNPIEIFERDNYICQSCKCKTSLRYKNPNHPKRSELDHIVPLSLGGDHSRLNTQCLCSRCNRVKGNTGVWDQQRMFG